MANVNDPSSFTSSDQIFATNHTLPQIRAIHKALHVQVEEKRNRLRTQVGGSYRELLGTADTIVRMRGDNDVVQDLLGRMGGRCGRAVVGAKASGLAKFESKQDKAEAAVAAKLRLLDASVLVVGRILKGGAGLDEGLGKGERLVLATKVLVLGKLLIKNLAEDEVGEAHQPAIETADAALGTLRQRLRKSVEKVLKRPSEDTDRENILKALCAYSLVTSSGARDMLRHFLRIRGEAIALAFDVGENERERSADSLVRGLKLYTRTILDVQALVPAKLSLALSGLKGRPLFADPALKSLEGLRLDIYERWCGEEIQYFTPFIRHDDLDGKHAKEMLMDWLRKQTKVLLDGLNKTLEQMTEFKAIMDLRTTVLQLWIRDGGKARGIDPSDMQDDLREAINSRMLAVLNIKVGKLRLVGSEISGTLARWKDGITDDHLSLWSDEGYNEALSQGAGPFVQEVVTRLYGRNDAASKAVHSYKSWYHVIDDVKEVVESLRKQRWDNDYDEIEDEETIEMRQQLLSRDDPKVLQQRLDTTLDKSFEELEQQIQELWEDRAPASNSNRIAIYLVRVIRDIRHQLPDRPAIKDFGLALVPALHSKIAIATTAQALDDFSKSELTQRTVPGRALWEGEPPLPNQPSPEVFQFLRTLSLTMTDVGVDLWTSAAMAKVKQHLSKQLCEKWLETMAEVLAEAESEKPGQETEEKDKESEEDDKEETKKEEEAKEENDETPTAALTPQEMADLFTQWLFDIAYLRNCIGTPVEGTRDEFKGLEEMIYERTKLESGPARQRIIKLSHDYWNRTSLLFGLLA